MMSSGNAPMEADPRPRSGEGRMRLHWSVSCCCNRIQATGKQDRKVELAPFFHRKPEVCMSPRLTVEEQKRRWQGQVHGRPCSVTTPSWGERHYLFMRAVSPWLNYPSKVMPQLSSATLGDSFSMDAEETNLTRNYSHSQQDRVVSAWQEWREFTQPCGLLAARWC